MAVLGASAMALSACSSSSSPEASVSRQPSYTSTLRTTTTMAPTTTIASTTTTTTAATTTTITAAAGGTLPNGRPLAGKIVGIDPGHNGANYTNPAFLNQQVFNGRTEEDCDTTGTQTAGGYTEAQYNFNVAQFLITDLQSEGAQVVLTRPTNTGVGPCVDQRAQVINSAHADVAVDIHADGGPVNGRGSRSLNPWPTGPTTE